MSKPIGPSATYKAISVEGPGPSWLARKDPQASFQWTVWRADDWQSNPKHSAILWIKDDLAHCSYQNEAVLKSHYYRSQIHVDEGRLWMPSLNPNHDPKDLTSPVFINHGHDIFEAMRVVRNQAHVISTIGPSGSFTEIAPHRLRFLRGYFSAIVEEGQCDRMLEAIKSGDVEAITSIRRKAHGDASRIKQVASFMKLIEKELSSTRGPQTLHEDIAQVVEELALESQQPPRKKVVAERSGLSTSALGKRLPEMGLAWLPSLRGPTPSRTK